MDSSRSHCATTRWEKLFWKNEHGTLALTNAEVTLTADPESKIRIGLAASKDDSGSVANRKTDPGVTEVDDGIAQSVPTGSLGAGEAIGVWVELALTGGDSARNSSFTTQLAGASV